MAGCQRPARSIKETPVQQLSSVKIILLPLGDINKASISSIEHYLKTVHSEVQLLPAEKLPQAAWYAPRKRYRADSIIQILAKRAAANEVYVGITNADISTRKGNISDFGVMGLGYMPGKACVASLYRLKNKSSFYKVVTHELGHTAGLPHCSKEYCYLRDARGGDPTAEEKKFCNDCWHHLKGKGWLNNQ
ncbi:MAG: hypothetical protein QM687_01360 [Ferruginibacter sp.]